MTISKKSKNITPYHKCGYRQHFNLLPDVARQLPGAKLWETWRHSGGSTAGQMMKLPK